MEPHYDLIWVVVALVSVTFIVVVGVLNKSGSTGTESTPPVASATPPPTTPPAPAGGHTSKNGGLLRFSFNLLVLGLVCLVLWFLGTLTYRYIGLGEAPALRTQSSGFVAQTPPVSTKWVDFVAPTKSTYVIEGEAGYDIEVCRPDTDPDCTDPMEGFRLFYDDMSGVERVWNPPEKVDARRLKVQSTGSAPLPMIYRYKPKP